MLSNLTTDLLPSLTLSLGRDFQPRPLEQDEGQDWIKWVVIRLLISIPQLARLYTDAFLVFAWSGTALLVCDETDMRLLCVTQFDEAEKQKMKEKTAIEEQERGNEVETLRQKHAETVDEIDQVFVRSLISQSVKC